MDGRRFHAARIGLIVLGIGAGCTWLCSPSRAGEDVPLRSVLKSRSASNSAGKSQSPGSPGSEKSGAPQPVPLGTASDAANQPTPAKKPQPATADPSPPTRPFAGQEATDHQAPPAASAEPQQGANAEDRPTSAGRSNASLPRIDPAQYNDVQPGKTTTSEVIASWGAPQQRDESGDTTTLVYSDPAFERLEVLTSGRAVRAIAIHFKTALPPQQLVEMLEFGDVRPVEVQDPGGRVLGLAFPETGVLFSFADGETTRRVGQVLIEQIDPQAFFARAEARRFGTLAQNLADVAFVIRHQPDSAAAHALRGELHLEVGHIGPAAEAAAKAIELDPRNPRYLLLHAVCLGKLARYQEAIQATEAVVALNSVAPEVRGRALTQLGDLLAEGPPRDYKRAVELHKQAVGVCSPLATDDSVAVRRAAKQVLIDAHLGIAYAIGWGNWRRKSEVVPLWIDQASQIAEDMIANDGGWIELRLRVFRRALAAHAGFQPSIEPDILLKKAEQAVRAIAQASDDPLRRQNAGWELGLAYAHAVRIDHLASRLEEGLRHGEAARRHLESNSQPRATSEVARLQLGRLYFALGALHAVHQEDHEAAISWYGKAAPLLAPRPGMQAPDPLSLGESLVSMGVSYWQVDLQQKALELTEQGTELMKQAVASGAISKTSLAVPYHNLSAMHQQLGDQQQADRFIQLAAESQGTDRR